MLTGVVLPLPRYRNRRVHTKPNIHSFNAFGMHRLVWAGILATGVSVQEAVYTAGHVTSS